MLEMMQKQMDTIAKLTEENTLLRHSSSQSATRKPDRPVIEPNCSDNDWAIFEDSWARYKNMTRINAEADKIMELRACCSTEVNKLLFDFVGPEKLNSSTEDELLKLIKSLAVKGVHKEVHRLNFTRMHQDQDEPITQFVARLKAQASLCDYIICCSTEGCAKISYAEEMVSHQMVSGLANPDHQSRILADVSSLTTFKEKLDRLISLETTAESAPQLSIAQGGTRANATSQYRKSKDKAGGTGKPKIFDKKKSVQPNVKCSGCGSDSHPPGKSMIRTDCPAWGKTCNNCGRPNHFRAVCRQSKAQSSRSEEANVDEEEQSDATLASMATFF